MKDFDAWIDHLSYLDELDNPSTVVLQPGEHLLVRLLYFSGFLGGQPRLAADVLHCVAAVNQGYLKRGQPPRLVLMPL